ncbi:MAG: HNH endonuclease [Desulfoarculaceae bacterium]|nr:HNH endonuclease [Desulfoarculaceae bacterium]
MKRNEKVYFIAGQHSVEDFTIAFVLTDSRLFFVKPQYAFQVHTGKISRLRITPGMKPVSLSSIIAIDVPSCVPEFSVNNVKVKFVYRKIVTAPKIPLLLPESARSMREHLNNGKDVLLPFEEGLEAELCHSLLKEMVDRINDPLDDSVFSPKRERMADDIKVAVWRRDGGACVRRGCRERLEYDHIIPVPKGGSNTLRNIELLCEACNRMKSARIM